MKNRLAKLFQNNARKGAGFQVKAEADNEATVYLFDAIGGWFGIEAQEFVREIAGIAAGTIHLRINSPGGDVFDARAMQTALRQHPSKVVAHIDGLAASAATFLAMGADEVEIAEGGFFMIHNAWSLMMGNAAEMREMADLLEKIDASIAGDYRRKTAKDEAQIAEWMAAESWFNAEEALAHGFVDRIFESAPAENRFDLSAYDNTPEALTAAPQPPAYDRATLERRLAFVERFSG